MSELSFLAEDEVVVPGEVVVVLAPEAGRALAVTVPSGPSRGLLTGTAEVGDEELDTVLSDLGVLDVRRVHGPLPPAPLGVFSADTDGALEGTFRVRFDPSTDVADAVTRLSGAAAVATAEPVFLRESFVVPNDPSFPRQWGLTKIRAPEAWERTTGDASVVVAVVDSGVDLDHPELVPLLLPGQDMVDLGTSPPPPLPGWVWEGDFAGRDNVPQDEVGHGTHVAGTIACSSNEGVGVAGVTWACRILPVKVLNRARRLADGVISGFGTSVDIAAGIQWAADHGARVINLSLGGAGRDQVTANAVAYAVTRGCVVVAAMGNTGTAVPQYPAALPDVLAVGATDANDVRASFSSTGQHIGVAAPGVDVYSTVWDNTHGSKNGTSMASPHVAGIAALVLSCNGNLSQTQVRQIIRDTARPLRDTPADAVPNDRYGSGLVDARAAVDRACPAPSVPVAACPSRVVLCQPSALRCPPTLPLRCPSRTVICNSLQIRCQPSLFLRCISVSIRCPSVTVRCVPVPDIPGGPGGPGGAGWSSRDVMGEEYGDDPYATDFGDDL